jgi:hypothetical protein
MDTPVKPLPQVNPCATPFWENTRQHRLVIQKCGDCSQYVFYPRLLCPFCHSEALSWVEASGKGTVYSFTVVQNNAPSAFLQDMPYVVAIVRLDEGVQMLTNIAGCPPDAVHCDMAVEVTFEKLDEYFTLPKFQPRSEES